MDLNRQIRTKHTWSAQVDIFRWNKQSVPCQWLIRSRMVSLYIPDPRLQDHQFLGDSTTMRLLVQRAMFLLLASVKPCLGLLDIPLRAAHASRMPADRFVFGRWRSINCFDTDVCCKLWAAYIIKVMTRNQGAIESMDPEYIVSSQARCNQRFTIGVAGGPEAQGCFFSCESTRPQSEIELSKTTYTFSYTRGNTFRDPIQIPRVRTLHEFYLECPDRWHWRAAVLPQRKPWDQDPNAERMVGVCHPEGSEPRFPATVYDLGPKNKKLQSSRKKRRGEDSGTATSEARLTVTLEPESKFEIPEIDLLPFLDDQISCLDLPSAPWENSISDVLFVEDYDEQADERRVDALHSDLEQYLPADMRRGQPAERTGIKAALERLMAIHASLEVYLPPELRDGASGSGTKPGL